MSSSQTIGLGKSLAELWPFVIPIAPRYRERQRRPRQLFTSRKIAGAMAHSKERSRPVSDVVVRALLTLARGQAEERLGSVEGLDLELLVHTEH